MTTKTIDVQTAQADLRQLIEEALAGSEIVLADEHGPLVKLVPVTSAPQSQRIAGLYPDAMTMSDDFDEPLPDEFWSGTE